MRHRRYGRTILLLALIAGAAMAGTSRAAEEQRYAALEETLRGEMAATGTTGAAVAVVEGDRVVYARGYGAASAEAPTPVTADTLFRIGSTTKMFTAAAATSLAEAGKVRLDRPIKRYVPQLSGRLARLTLHQLLTHTAGLRDGAEPYGRHDDAALGDAFRGWTDERLFTRPGAVFSYANPGYNLAGYVLEQAAGKPFADLVQERVFQPLGMGHTTFRAQVAMSFPVAQGHVPGDGGRPVVVRPYTDNVAEWPSGFLFSSANDLARWMIAFMNDGMIEGKRGLTSRQIALLSTPYVDIQDVFPGRYGYGLMISRDRGFRVVDHGGIHIGFASQLKMVPARRFGIVVLGNSGAPLSRTMERALQMGLGVGPAVGSPLQSKPITAVEARRISGRFGTPPAQVELRAQDGGVVLRQGGLELPVTKVGENRYAVTPPGAPGPFQFVLVPGADGRAEYFSVDFHKMKRAAGPPGKSPERAGSRR